MIGDQKTCWVTDAGLIRYEAACELQRQVLGARKAAAVPDVLIFCEHPHVITLGRNGSRENLLAGNPTLEQMNVEFRATDRGGDITYHGPGQVVGYPILDLTEHRRDVRWYVEQLEDVMMRTSADFGVRVSRVEGRHGVWVRGDSAAAEAKLGAVGVHLSRWITSHGFAYNVLTDLRYFDLIVPCGIAGRGATSLERLLGRPVAMKDARERLAFHFGQAFERDIVPVAMDQLKRAIEGVSLTEQRQHSILAETEVLRESRA